MDHNADMIRMANQIATFFKSYSREEAIQEISTHINSFWEPRMRVQFFAYLDKGGTGFDPLVVEASQRVRRPETRRFDMPEAHDQKSGLPKEPKEA
jgi:formate dehydrogenase subunit delta